MNATENTTAMDLIRQIAEAELSLRSRIAHGVLLAAASAMTVIIVSLWLTEPDLPLRTQTAFAALTTIGAAWAGYAIWVLTQRRVLFARQRVIAGRMAVVFSAVFTTGAFVIGLSMNEPAGFAAAGLGVVLVAISGLLLGRAERRLTALLDRKRELEGLRGGAA